MQRVFLPGVAVGVGLLGFALDFGAAHPADDGMLYAHIHLAGHVQHQQDARLVGLRKSVALESRARGGGQFGANLVIIQRHRVIPG